mmetsp:Transcript_105744/g.188101  ORF Transcript_105744/g.188101 Transcript_105744/m.188101 type:complete len:498 (-) Transcript_105744:163-1656(-)|eukprot:CAMPEP_0197648574 /NCGR_PEP_ID=MMETSP1338-20131121/27840_1 /TAXON_ID=43686 ORGANISM="Pelagodinium beii, Strain RCC1491" /NCGR_SAMPLE_ID=MMETSP1338 /ASSEMBLY_ACC=CAM_ASM_000754 /LENGTH=497 /DNA_ID=CAMNT_0043222607 /DNA_START=68 /DNA_END=1564 /DNA_ORIENTATION=+
MASPAHVEVASTAEADANHDEEEQLRGERRNKTWLSEEPVQSALDGPRLNKRTQFVLGFMNLVDCIGLLLLNPYAMEMVSQLQDKPINDPDVIRNMGYLIGIYNLAEMIFSPLWGILSEYTGRKPALLIGYAGAAVMSIFFGTASSLGIAYFTRFMIGFFSGNLSITKTVLGELVDKSNEARAFGMLGFCYGVGMVIGPIFGGFLVHKGFPEYPYLLPNLAYSILSASACVVGALFLPETLPRERRKSICRRSPQELPDSSSSNVKGQHRVPPKLIAMMLSYGVVVASCICTAQMVTQVLQLPLSDNGFAASPDDLAVLQIFAAAGLFVMQLAFFPCLTKAIGYRACFIMGIALVGLVIFLFPVYGLIADPKFGDWRWAPLAFMMFVQQGAFELLLPTTIIWVNRYAEGLPRGTINGLSNCFAALLRAVSPTLVSLSLTAGLSTHTDLGKYMPLLVIGALLLLALCLAVPSLPKFEATKADDSESSSAESGSTESEA